MLYSSEDQKSLGVFKSEKLTILSIEVSDKPCSISLSTSKMKNSLICPSRQIGSVKNGLYITHFSEWCHHHCCAKIGLVCLYIFSMSENVCLMVVTMQKLVLFSGKLTLSNGTIMLLISIVDYFDQIGAISLRHRSRVRMKKRKNEIVKRL